MELMQKYTKDDGAIGVDDLERWPSDCNAVGFLSMTTSATSVDELLQVTSTTFFDEALLIHFSIRSCSVIGIKWISSGLRNSRQSPPT